MAKKFKGPMVRYNVVAHPSQILVKHVEILKDGTLSKGRGGKIPAGCTVTTKMVPLARYVHDAF